MSTGKKGIVNNTLPKVSVIVPVRNGERTAEKLLKALLAQDYPKDKTEILIVDNDSSDRTVEIIRKYPVALDKENRTHSSYAARNKGLSIAGGEIIAFTDADCTPKKDWIGKGVHAMMEKEADMAGGKINFVLPVRPSAAELVDSVTCMQNERIIKKRRAAVTANLFVRRELFDKIGFFEEVQSGADIKWAQKATRRGFSLIYAPEAVVYHPARYLRELMQTSRRYGRGFPGIPQNRFRYFMIFLVIMRQLLPVPSINVLKLMITGKRHHNILKHIFTLGGVSYLFQLNKLAGIILFVFTKKK